MKLKDFTNYAESIGQTRYADMVKVGFAYGLRIHEVARLDKNDLLKSLNENQLTVKGKGGLVRNVPLHDSELIRWLYNITPVGEKVFVRQDEKAHHVINSLQSFIIRNQDKFVENIDNSRHFHGLRHLYAQTRYKVFVEEGLNERQAKLKVAHELGHFRAEITEVYLK